MRKRTLGIVREGYSKWERRSPLTPSHVARTVREQGLRVIVQPSTLRVFTNDEYVQAGAEVSESLEECDCIVGVKQVAIDSVLPRKTYVFFSHTIKAQEGNMKLLDRMLEKKVRLIDHECIRDLKTGERLVAFGDYAGRAGMLESLRGLGFRLLGLGYSTPFLNLGPAYSYKTLNDAMVAASAVCEDYSRRGGAKSFLPKGFGPMCFIFTGSGKVSRGAQDVFAQLPNTIMLDDIRDLERMKQEDNMIYGLVVRDVDVMRKEGQSASDSIDRKDYFANPHLYNADLFATKVLPHANLVLTGAYWDSRYPKWMPNTKLITNNSKKLLMVADVSCDVNGTFEGLTRSTTIEDPFYYTDFGDAMKEVTKEQFVNKSKKEFDPNLKLVLGVDILPSELPREASNHFGDCLYPFLPQLCQGNDCGDILERATIAKDGSLTPQYAYIGKMRAERERSKRMAVSIKEDEEKRLKLIKLEGHLFDTKLINRVLDLIENKRGKFQILQASLAQPRGGPGRELRAHTAVLLKVVGEPVGSDAVDPTDDLIKSIERLVRESPAEAEASMSLLGPDDAKLALADLQGTDRSRKETASFSHSLPRVSSTPPIPDEGEVVILGSGMVSAPAIDYLSRSNPRKVIRVVGGDTKELDILKKRFAHLRHVHFDHLAIKDSNSLKSVMERNKTKCVVSLLPAPMHLDVAQACLDNHVPLVTASYVGRMEQVHGKRARELEVPILCEMGLDPGMDHMSSMKVFEENGGGKNLLSFASFCGGLPAPEAADNPLGYKLSWSPRGVLTALKNPSRYLKQGQMVEVNSILEACEPFQLSAFAFPAMNLESMPNRDATIYAQPYGVDLNITKTFMRGTLRFRGFCEVLLDFSREGWLDETPGSAMQFKEMTWGDVGRSSPFSERTRAYLQPYESIPVAAESTRLDSLCDLLKQTISMKPNERDLVLMEHRFEFMDGSKATSSLVVFGNDKDSAMSRTVGLTAAIGAQLLLEGKHPKGGGVFMPTERWVYLEALKRLEKEGLGFEETSVQSK